MIEWERPAWTDEAKCRAAGPTRFYATDAEEEAAAKAVCNGEDGLPPCPSRLECLEYALEHNEKHGVWGGRSERERIGIRRIKRRRSVPKVVRTVKRSALRPVLETPKSETRILGAVQRHLLTRPPEERDQDVIHPSEMCKSDWCPRATFFRIAGAPALEEEPNPFTRENVFAEGHEIHRKWQRWLWEMGLLRGMFGCSPCGHEWPAIAPRSCPACGAGEQCVQYLEVPVRSEKYLISGHADGDIADDPNDDLCPLLEVKSIGVGTLRFEAPQLLSRHTHKVEDDDGTQHTLVDLEGLWRDIKRPFPTHLRQGNVYMAASGRRRMVFIYEAKWSQQVKEFRVRYQPETVEALLDACLDVRYGLDSGNPPARPEWAAPGVGTCGQCIYRDPCWDPFMENGNAAQELGARCGESGGDDEAGEGRLRIAGSSGLRHSEVASQAQ